MLFFILLLGDSEFMLSFSKAICKRILRKHDEEALNEHTDEVNSQEVENSSQQNSYANAGVLNLEKAASLDIIEEGYGKARKSGEKPR